MNKEAVTSTKKRPYRKTGKYSTKGNPVKVTGGDIYRITEAFNVYTSMTKRERVIFQNIVKQLN
jgi:hypothetical protein